MKLINNRKKRIIISIFFNLLRIILGDIFIFEIINILIHIYNIYKINQDCVNMLKKNN